MGLPGFPEAKTFVLIDGHGDTPFRWLQAFERPDLALIVIDPLEVAPDFPIAGSAAHAMRSARAKALKLASTT